MYNRSLKTNIAVQQFILKEDRRSSIGFNLYLKVYKFYSVSVKVTRARGLHVGKG
jgi:hypothetical protein